MKIIRPSWEILNEPNWGEVMLQLERAMRTCYKSEDKITEGSAEKLIRSIIARGHESTLEHISFSVKFIVDRGVSHELVRHRHCSFSQESTRYVKYDGEMEFIMPPWVSAHIEAGDTDDVWLSSMAFAEERYRALLGRGWLPQQARSVLPNSLKTEIVVTTNLRDWRHIFHLRCDKTAHPQMREVMVPLYDYLVSKCPAIFDTVAFNRAGGE
jgi:thymidylate synthase (FAD)